MKEINKNANTQNKPLVYPEVKNFDTDVLVIGNDMSAALTAFMLNELGIKTVVISNCSKGENKLIDLDQQFIELLNQFSLDMGGNLFIEFLDLIYKLSFIAKRVNFRLLEKPALKCLSYSVKDSTISVDRTPYGFSVLDDLIRYSSGIVFNTSSFCEAIFTYCKANCLEIIENSQAIEFNLENDSLEVRTLNGCLVKCNQLYLSALDGKDDLLFSDEFIKAEDPQYNTVSRRLLTILSNYKAKPRIFINANGENALIALIRATYIADNILSGKNIIVQNLIN